MMNGEITVLYDGACPFCRGTVHWLERSAQRDPVRFLPQASAEARERFPTLVTTGPPADLVAVEPNGSVHRAEGAWIVILRSLRYYRWAGRLISWRGIRPIARWGVGIVGRHRYRLSRWIPGARVGECRTSRTVTTDDV